MGQTNAMPSSKKQLLRHGAMITRSKVLKKANRNEATAADWEEIMSEVWAAQKEAAGKTPNPVLVERERRRR